jgi:hypothetical protein
MTLDADDNLIRMINFQKLLICIVISCIKESRFQMVSNFDQRLIWNYYTSRHSGTPFFIRALCMTSPSITKIVNYLYNDLEVENGMAGLRGGAILPELCLYLTIRFLSGGSYLDVGLFLGIS